MIMQGKRHGYWRKVHEESEWQSEENIVLPGSGKGVKASCQGRQENGTGVPYSHLCVGEWSGRCEKTVILDPCISS
jgi:hypothetical protein